MSNMPDMPDDSAISLMADDQYFRAVRWNERLSEEEVAKYLERVVRGSSERSKPVPNQWVLSLARDARDRLVEDYQPLVIYYAKRAFRRFTCFDLMDVVQVGNIGLLKALETYHPSEEPSFPMFAGCLIRCALRDALYQGDSTIAAHGGPNVYHLIQVRRFEAHFLSENGYKPSAHEVAEALELSSQEVAHVLQARKFETSVSLQQAMLFESGREGKEAFDPLFPSASVERTSRHEELCEVLDQAMAPLTDAQKEAVSLRFGLSQDRPCFSSYVEIGQALSVGSHAVKSRYDKALARLRKVLALRMKDRQPFCELIQADYYTVPQVALLLGVNVETVRRLIHAGRLSATWETVPFVGGEIFKVSKEPVDVMVADHRRLQAERENYYTLAQTASLLGVTKATASRYVSTGRLPGKKGIEDGARKVFVCKQAVHALMAEYQSSEVA